VLRGSRGHLRRGAMPVDQTAADPTGPAPRVAPAPNRPGAAARFVSESRRVLFGFPAGEPLASIPELSVVRLAALSQGAAHQCPCPAASIRTVGGAAGSHA